MSTPAFGSPAALEEIEKIRSDRKYLSDLYELGALDRVPDNKREKAEIGLLNHRMVLIRRKNTHRNFQNCRYEESAAEQWEGDEFQFHPSYWYVKALIKERELTDLGVNTARLSKSLYEPRHDWLFYMGNTDIGRMSGRRAGWK